jgi:hypothetical protein
LEVTLNTDERRWEILVSGQSLWEREAAQEGAVDILRHDGKLLGMIGHPTDKASIA